MTASATPPTDDAAQASGVPQKTQRAIAQQEFFDPRDLTVAGDDSTPYGALFANTMLDDGRQHLPWTHRHEQIVLGFATGCDFVKNPYAAEDEAKPKRAGVPKGDPQLIYLQLVAGDPPYAMVTDNGRQRRRCAIEFDRRAAWLINEFLPQCAGEKPAQQRIKLRNLAIEFAQNNPSHAEAKWLTRPFVNALLGQSGTDDGIGEGTGWYDKSWRPLPLLLRVQIIGVDVDPMNPALRIQAVARKEAQIDTPPSLRAKQIKQALDLKNPESGEPLLNPKSVAQLLSMGDDALNNSLLILQCVPEVQAAIDSGRLSAKVALIGNPGKRDAAMVLWPKNQPRGVITEAQQRWVLKGLFDAFPGDERIRGAKAFKVGLRLRTEALKGNMTDAAAAAASTDDAATAPDGATTDGAAQGDDATQAAAPASKPKRPAIDRDMLARITEHAGRQRDTLPDPTENGLSTTTILDRQRDVVSVAVAAAMAKYLGGELAALDPFPALKAVMLAVAADTTPAGPTLSADEIMQELCASALDAWDEIPEQFRQLEKLKIADDAQVNGRAATEAERTAAQEELTALADSYRDGVAAGTVDDAAQRDPGIFLRERLYAAPAQAAPATTPAT